jgi:hypothetical protein
MMGPQCHRNSKQISLSWVQYSADNWKMIQSKRNSVHLHSLNVVSRFQLNDAARSQISTHTTTTTNNNND